MKTAPEEIDYEDEWAVDNNIGQSLTRGRGFVSWPYPIMFNPEHCLLQVTAGGSFYILNRLSWSCPSFWSIVLGIF